MNRADEDAYFFFLIHNPAIFVFNWFLMSRMSLAISINAHSSISYFCRFIVVLSSTDPPLATVVSGGEFLPDSAEGCHSLLIVAFKNVKYTLGLFILRHGLNIMKRYSHRRAGFLGHKNFLNYFFKKFEKSNGALLTLLHRPTQAAMTAAAFWAFVMRATAAERASTFSTSPSCVSERTTLPSSSTSLGRSKRSSIPPVRV